MNGKITYRQQFTRCGKQRCRKCQAGLGHGPYWYAYWSENGRTISKYIGTTLPADTESELTRQVSSGNETRRALHQTQNVGTNNSQQASLIPAYSLKIYALGQFHIEYRQDNEWKIVDGRTWHRRRARALLGCLLSYPGRRLGREQIMEMLWPDTEIDVAANRLNGAVHELRQLLEPDLKRPANSQMLRLEHDMLELADSTHIWVDAEAFEGLLREADTASEPTQVKRYLEGAAALYQGHYLLEELYSEWATQRRDALQRAWVGLLLRLAEFQKEAEEYASAIETLDRLRSADPTNETALQRLMILLTQRDRRGEAIKVYQQHCTMLLRDYECDPLPETIELYEKLRQGHIPTDDTTRSGTYDPPMEQESLQPGQQTQQTSATAGQHTISQQSTDNVTPPATLQMKRPRFQPGRLNQSPLIGRERESYILRHIMLSLESTTEIRTSAASAKPSAAGIAAVEEEAFTPPADNIETYSKGTHFILLRGESGIGKTRLAEELSMEAYHRGWAVAWSRSYEQESSIPYHPWAELLRTFYQSMSEFIDKIQAEEQNMNRYDSARNAYEVGSMPFKLERLNALIPDLVPNDAARPITTFAYEQERLHLWEAALGIIEAFSRIHPLLLVLDDLHWADDSSIELLMYLIHHLQNQSVLFIGTCRDGELAPQHKLRALIADLQREQAIALIPVQPLTSSQIGALVAHLPEDLVENIQSQAAGNPFFAEELARYADSTAGEPDSNTSLTTVSGSANETSSSIPTLSYTSTPTTTIAQSASGSITVKNAVEPARMTTALPAAISAMLERRFKRLSKNCQTLLNKAAIIGGSFELRHLLPIANEWSEDTVLDLLEEALEAGLLSEEGAGAHIVYHFWHPLIISFLYTRLSAARRALLHRKVAEALLTTNNQPEKLAATIVYHLNKGGGDLQLLAHYAELAGEQAHALGAYAEAQQYYIQVLQAQSNNELYTEEASNIHEQIEKILAREIHHLPLEDPRHTCRMLERAAECSIILGDFTEGRLLYEYILTLRNSAPFQQYLASTAAAHDEIQRTEAQTQALLWREISNAWADTSAYEQAYASYQRGKEVMIQAGITSGAAWACLHLHYGALLRVEGNYHEARLYLQEALTMLEACVQERPLAKDEKQSPTRIERALHGDPLDIGYAHERLGIVAASLGEINSALEHLHTALTLYEQNELITEMARVCGNLGAVYILRGKHADGRTFMERALSLAERGGEIPTMTFVMLNLGDVAQRSGALQEAESLYKQSLSLAERINDRERISWGHVALATVQKDLGSLQEAAQSIRRAITIARAIKNARCLYYALVGLASLRITQATSEYQTSNPQPQGSLQQEPRKKKGKEHLLRLAQAALQRANTMTGVEIETVIEGRLQLALAQLMLHDNEHAYQTARQALQEAQDHETTQIQGRAYLLLGRIQEERAEHFQAEHYYQQALTLNKLHGLELDYARTLHYHGQYLIKQAIGSTQPPAQRSLQDKRYRDGQASLKQAQHIFELCQANLDLALTRQATACNTYNTPSRHNQFIPAN